MAEPSRNLERMGLLVLVAAALGFAGVIVVPRLPWTVKNTHSFVVPIDRGIQTLAPGANVFAAGLVAGEVVSIEPFSTTPAAVEADALRVVFTVPESFAIFEGAEARLVSALIGSATVVSLIDAFTPGRPRLANGVELPWLPPPDTLELVFGTRHWQQLRESIARFEGMFDAFPEERRNFSGEVTAIRDQATAIAEQVESDLDGWRIDRDRIIEGFKQARDAADRAANAFDMLRSTWGSMTDALAQVDSKVKALLPASGGNLEDLQLLGSLPDGDRLDGRFDGMVQSANALAPLWRGLIDVVGGPWEWAVDDVRLSIASMTLAVGQFDLIARDLERDLIAALLETIGVIAGTIPDETTLDRMQADEALRRFVMATADIRAANAAIEAWIREAPAEGLGDPVPPELRGWFERSQAEFAEAANALFRMRMRMR